eukprot:jgi/Mesvir1/8204/Mv12496-RA.1
MGKRDKGNYENPAAARYKVLGRIGEGTFGQVLKALNVETGEIVALKKIRVQRIEEGVPESLIREIKTLQHLDHPNVVKLLEVFPRGSTLILVFEFLPRDLAQVIAAARCQGRRLPEAAVKGLFQQLLQGVAACHAAGIMHRDLKPANLLLTADGVLKLADFGLARVHADRDGAQYTHTVATRWYRSPELLYGARHYDTSVDLWAVGCILAELLGLCPLFAGEHDIDQLYRVLKVLGTPTQERWPGVEALPDFNKISFPDLPPTPLSLLLPGAPAEAIRMVERFVRYDSHKRVTAEQALLDPYMFRPPYPLLGRPLMDSLSEHGLNTEEQDAGQDGRHGGLRLTKDSGGEAPPKSCKAYDTNAHVNVDFFTILLQGETT